MLILATKLFRAPIVTPSAGKLGELGNPIVNPSDAHLLAFHVLPSTLFGRKKIISITDIIVLDPKIVLINSPESIIDSQEIIRVKESADQQISLLKTKAYTKSKVYLGRVEDIVIDSETNMIIKYYIKHIIQSRILPADKVVETKHNKIIFDDTVIAPNVEVKGVPA
ncbi:MAG: hypothetical protein Q7S37_04855 [bacterium]|nr:hypothetical protein [bacterium]